MEFFSSSAISNTPEHIVVKFTKIIDAAQLAGNFLRHLLDDQFVVGAAEPGADQDPVDPARQQQGDGLRAAASLKRAFAVGHQADPAVRAAGLGQAVSFGIGGDETVELVMATPEGIDEDPAMLVADGRLEADRGLAVQTDMVRHQAVSVGTEELLDDEEILPLLLDVFDSIGQRGQELGWDDLVDKFHRLILGCGFRVLSQHYHNAGCKKKDRLVKKIEGAIFSLHNRLNCDNRALHCNTQHMVRAESGPVSPRTFLALCGFFIY